MQSKSILTFLVTTMRSQGRLRGANTTMSCRVKSLGSNITAAELKRIRLFIKTIPNCSRLIASNICFTNILRYVLPLFANTLNPLKVQTNQRHAACPSLFELRLFAKGTSRGQFRRMSRTRLKLFMRSNSLATLSSTPALSASLRIKTTP